MSNFFPLDGSPQYRLLRAHLRGLVKRFEWSLEHPRAAQAKRLKIILRACMRNDYGRLYRLSEVRDLSEFRERLPVVTHQDLLGHLTKIADGDKGVLTTEAVIQLLETSGTTGQAKLLPVTRSWAKSISQAQQLWTLALLQQHPSVASGKALTIVSADVDRLSAGGIPIGSNTGRMAGALPGWIRRSYFIPSFVRKIEEHDIRLYVTLRLALQENVTSWTTANPSMVLQVLNRLEEWSEALSVDLSGGHCENGPAVHLSPKVKAQLQPLLRKGALPFSWKAQHIWPLAAINCWTNGPASYFAERVCQRIGGVALREVGITASEGYFALPINADMAGGVAWLNGHLLEFRTEEGKICWAWELEIGKRYSLIVSTESGLLRYDLQDIVEVVGWSGQAPLLRFVAKRGDFINAVGEKVSAEQLSLAMLRLGDAVGSTFCGFSCAVKLGERPQILVGIETDEDVDLASCALQFDHILSQLNSEFASKLHSSRLQATKFLRFSAGTFARYKSAQLSKGASESQIKDPVVVDYSTWERIRQLP